ncbi:MAG TPA: sigma-54 dependent transcriptional regulator [Planctomycetota bacterium]|nr:sigma-54 dependent transcriptional regulator [Planctomycetota bacterium]
MIGEDMVQRSGEAIEVLVVDDEAYVRDSLSEVLQAEGMRPHAVDGARAAIEFLSRKRVDVIVTDLRMPSGDGMMLLEESRSLGAAIPILVITGVGTVGEAVQAIKAGAFDFLQKPVDPEELAVLVRRAAEHRRLVGEVASLRSEVQDRQVSRQLVGSSLAMESVRAAIRQVAPTEATVLITGESGTGKELAAEEIHRSSARARGPLVRVSCAALPPERFERVFFGERFERVFLGERAEGPSGEGPPSEERGRFAEAEGGTLVLDEVGALQPGAQARLLRVLETGEFQPLGESRVRVADVRVIATSNADLAAQVEAGRFRRDLLYRLAVFPIEMPPLRAHKEDLAEIARHLLERPHRLPRARALGAPVDLGGEALDVLASYDWPGNVRELSNVLERAAIISGAEPLRAELLRDLLEANAPPPEPRAPAELNLRKNLDALERGLVLKAVAVTRGKKKEACELLGIDPRNLGYYLRKHAITDEELRSASG